VEGRVEEAITSGHWQDVHFDIAGVSGVKATGEAEVMSADSPDETNSLQDPKRIAPETSAIHGLGKSFTRTFPPYSVTVLRLKSS
jgi:alpha-N-arabinofuranosidase